MLNSEVNRDEEEEFKLIEVVADLKVDDVLELVATGKMDEVELAAALTRSRKWSRLDEII